MGLYSNWAPTNFLASMVTSQAAVPVHAPLQPVKRYPDSGLGVSRTRVPLTNLTLQILAFVLHFKPAGSLVISPFGVLTILSGYLGSLAKTAPTVVLCVRVRLQVLPVGAGQPIHFLR